MTIIDELKSVFDELDEEFGEETRQLAAVVASDLARLQAEAAIGKSVERELAHAKAAARSLVATAGMSALDAVTEAFGRWSSKFLASALEGI